MSDRFPLVCICIPTYNAAATIKETLDSILSQSYPNLVVHISDNASIDDTVRIIEQINDPRITIHKTDNNLGAEGNFTQCIQLAEGKYTAIFHADDLYKPDMVAKQVAFLENNPNISAVFAGADTIDERGAVFGAMGKVPGTKSLVSFFDFQHLLQAMLLHHNFLICPSAMARTEIFKDGIREWGNKIYKSSSDVDVWLKLAKIGPIAVLGEKLMGYRISKAQFSDRIRNRTERTDFFIVMDNYLAQPEVRSFITQSDLRHYQWLERHERVARAFNLFGLARNAEAKVLLEGLFCFDAIRAAMSGRRGLVTLAGGILLQILLQVGGGRNGAGIVKVIKKITWR